MTHVSLSFNGPKNFALVDNLLPNLFDFNSQQFLLVAEILQLLAPEATSINELENYPDGLGPDSAMGDVFSTITIDDLVVFGDSYSDTGNIFTVSGYSFPPSPPYFQGRFSNGPIWVDYLAAWLDLEEEDVFNFATGGATTGREGFIPPELGFPLGSGLSTLLPGLLDQVDLYVALAGPEGLDPDDLHVLWFNGNELQAVDPSNPQIIQTTITQAMTNIATAVTSLATSGAAQIAIANAVDIGTLPQAQQSGLGEVGSQAAGLFNTALAQTVNQLEQQLNIGLIELDAFSTSQAFVAAPSTFGFANVATPLLDDLSGVNNPQEFLFWDDIHYTTQAQAFFAQAFLEDLAPTRISDIQGAGHTSPLVGESVTNVPGIVTAVDTNGFYLQDPNPDDNPTTSEGLFVFTGDAPTVSVGDSILLSGTVSEFIPGGVATGNLSITQMSDITDLIVLSSGNALPEATVIGAGGVMPPVDIIDNDLPEAYNVLNGEGSFDPSEDGLDFYETLEGMRVTVEAALAVSPTNRFGEIFTVTNNGEGATGLSERGTLNIAPDDFNPERVQIQFDRGILPDFNVPVNVGAQLGDVTGVVGYSFGNFEVNVTEPFEGVTPSGLVPEESRLGPTSSDIAIASYNVLNLDPNDGDGDTDVADGRFETIARHIADALNSPDIIALQEIQDNDGSVESDITAADETLQLLVDAIADISGIEYAFIDHPFIGNGTSGGQPGGNIRTAYLYDPERVELIEGSLNAVVDPVDQQGNPENPFFDSRLPLAATFLFNGHEVVVVNNHFSSKGGSQPLMGATQPSAALQEDPTVNGSLDERQAQAQAVSDYVGDILGSDPDANVVVLGDFNEFEFISPLATLETAGLNNLTNELPETERYTFIFQGNSQSLDHMLVSDSLNATALFDVVHVNSEFVGAASDHDPLLGQFSLNDNADFVPFLPPIDVPTIPLPSFTPIFPPAIVGL